MTDKETSNKCLKREREREIKRERLTFRSLERDIDIKRERLLVKGWERYKGWRADVYKDN